MDNSENEERQRWLQRERELQAVGRMNAEIRETLKQLA